MNRPRRSFPCESSPMSIQFKPKEEDTFRDDLDMKEHDDIPISKVFCLFSSPYELYYGEELLMTVEFLLFFQDKP